MAKNKGKRNPHNQPSSSQKGHPAAAPPGVAGQKGRWTTDKENNKNGIGNGNARDSDPRSDHDGHAKIRPEAAPAVVLKDLSNQVQSIQRRNQNLFESLKQQLDLFQQQQSEIDALMKSVEQLNLQTNASSAVFSVASTTGTVVSHATSHAAASRGDNGTARKENRDPKWEGSLKVQAHANARGTPSALATAAANAVVQHDPKQECFSSTATSTEQQMLVPTNQAQIVAEKQSGAPAMEELPTPWSAFPAAPAGPNPEDVHGMKEGLRTSLIEIMGYSATLVDEAMLALGVTNHTNDSNHNDNSIPEDAVLDRILTWMEHYQSQEKPQPADIHPQPQKSKKKKKKQAPSPTAGAAEAAPASSFDSTMETEIDRMSKAAEERARWEREEERKERDEQEKKAAARYSGSCDTTTQPQSTQFLGPPNQEKDQPTTIDNRPMASFSATSSGVNYRGNNTSKHSVVDGVGSTHEEETRDPQKKNSKQEPFAIATNGRHSSDVPGIEPTSFRSTCIHKSTAMTTVVGTMIHPRNQQQQTPFSDISKIQALRKRHVVC